ncbi:hypothetical protein [Porphyrobacter sp. GA68]|uniref:hypothetical protein n=1 Tax=Porphyrobacter sp. GA68 TaxID=2883480 RepID=UPI001D17ED03|nr:hypothetical protein [Porphyrobacter sp. GA68]
MITVATFVLFSITAGVVLLTLSDGAVKFYHAAKTLRQSSVVDCASMTVSPSISTGTVHNTVFSRTRSAPLVRTGMFRPRATILPTSEITPPRAVA